MHSSAENFPMARKTLQTATRHTILFKDSDMIPFVRQKSAGKKAAEAAAYNQHGRHIQIGNLKIGYQDSIAHTLPTPIFLMVGVTLQIPATKCTAAVSKPITHRGIVSRQTHSHKEVDFPFTKRHLLFRKNMPRPADESRNQIGMQPFGQVESSSMKTTDPAICGAGTFRENDNGITATQQVADSLFVPFDAVGSGIKFGITHCQPIERVTPDPIITQCHDAGRKQQQAKHIQMRLMVADDDGRPGKILAAGILYLQMHSRQTAESKMKNAMQPAMIAPFLFFCSPSDMKKQPRIRNNVQQYAGHEYAQHSEGTQPTPYL